MHEEEVSWELAIACAGLSGPVREVIAIRPGDEVGVEFRRDELSVHCLVLAFFFEVILQFDLSVLIFNLIKKQPLNFASKKVVRYIEHGVKVEFKKGLPFEPKPSAPKFVDPQDVDFAIQDLLKDRRIGTYQDLVPGGEQFLSRSRVHTPPGKGKQRIVHAL